MEKFWGFRSSSGHATGEQGFYVFLLPPQSNLRTKQQTPDFMCFMILTLQVVVRLSISSNLHWNAITYVSKKAFPHLS